MPERIGAPRESFGLAARPAHRYPAVTMNALLLPLIFLALPASGSLTAPAPNADKGEVKSGPPLKHQFDLKHSGERGVITITGVTSACGCSKWDATPKVLKPGEIAKLSVVINTLTQPEGPATWKSSVKYTLDSTPHELDLTVTAKIVREVAVEPPVLAMSISGDTERTESLRVIVRGASVGLLITKVQCTNPKVKLAFLPPSGSIKGTSQQIAVTLPADLTTGSHDDIITLTTTDPACPELKIPLKIAKRAAGDVSVSPDAATVRFAKGQTEASTLVQLRAGGKPISIGKVECKQDGVTVKFSEGSGPVATARIAVNLAKAGALGQADVILHLNEPAGGVVVLPVSWYVP